MKFLPAQVQLTINRLVTTGFITTTLASTALLSPSLVRAESTPMPPTALPSLAALQNSPLESPTAIAPNRATINAPNTTTYYLGAGDTLDIKVYDYAEYTGEQVILSDGTITLPLIGKVPAAQKTTEQLTQEITTRLKPLLKRPNVTIGVTKLRPLRISIAGEVQRPGPMQLQSTTPATAATGTSPSALVPTLSEALQRAGGITQRADIRHVVLQRSNAQGGVSETTLDLWQALKSAQPNSDILLMDGDAIYVPAVTASSGFDRRVAARASFSPKSIRVKVVGEVTRPGEVEVSPDATLSGAIANAGGPTDKARMDKVVFVRMDENGQVNRQELNLKNLMDSQQVQDGDVLMVPKDNGRNILDIASQALGPFGFLVNLFR
jgi:polysaccharide biosynthesis/export protein